MRKIIFVSLVSLFLGGCETIIPKTEVANAPQWLLNPPADSHETWWGVGEGQDRDVAKRAALKDVAAKLKVSISGKLESQVTDNNGRVDRQARNRISEEVQKTEFSNYTIEKTAQSGSHFYVLAKVDRQAFIRDAKAKLDAFDATIQQATSGLEKKSSIERFVSLRRLGPTLEKAVAQAQLLMGAEIGGSGLARLNRYQNLQQQTSDAATGLAFRLQSKRDDNDIAAAVATYLNESGMRADASPSSGGNILAISSTNRQDEIYGNKFVKLNVTLSVKDDRGQSIASRDFEVSGSSRYDFSAARQAAVQNLQTALREAGPIAGLGFNN